MIARCSVCRTSLNEWTADACPGGHVVVCAACPWESACDECEGAAA